MGKKLDYLVISPLFFIIEYMIFGAHVSSAGGPANSIKNATALGVQHLQTFLSAPQSYKVPEYTEEKIQSFLQAKSNSKIINCFAHAIYLLNFASEKESLRELSKENLIKTLNISAQLGFTGVVVHLGSTKDNIENGIKMVADGLRGVLAQSDPASSLYLENSAGAGNLIGAQFEHLAAIIDQNSENDRLKVCLDTQHMFASGYNVRTDPNGVLDVAFSILGERIQCIHLNDSKTEFHSKRDRHENIGEGLIGFESLRSFCTDSRLASIPLILEVPGFEGKGPDIQNIELVRSFEQIAVS